jgi:hypothetical protein
MFSILYLKCLGQKCFRFWIFFFFQILGYSHIYNEISCRRKPKSKHKIHLCFYAVHTHSLKVIFYNSFSVTCIFTVICHMRSDVEISTCGILLKKLQILKHFRFGIFRCFLFFCCCLFFFVCGTGIWTQSFVLARQMLYHLITTLCSYILFFKFFHSEHLVFIPYRILPPF